MLGAHAAIVDWTAAGAGTVASIGFGPGGLRRTIRASGTAQALDLADVGAVWTRRVKPATVSASILDTEQRRFAAAEWRDLLYGLFDSTSAVSPLGAQRGATKPEQLARAPLAGLAIPDTLITSSTSEATDFIDAHRGMVVHKAMNGPSDRLLETCQWDERHRAELERLRLAPTIFQELIEGPRDIRVTMIGTSCFAAAVGSGASRHVDSRLALDVPVTAYELPASVQSSLVRLMTMLGLKFATVDIKESRDGTLYFLELNPQGQFLYVEILTGLPIAVAMAKYLTGLDAQGG
jgi:ribosomal protein S6-L-glutamate ligase RimK-like protein